MQAPPVVRRAAIKAPVILVADDDAQIRNIVKAKLSQMRCRVLTAGSGDSALSVAREKRPALILLDVMMPGKTGWEVAKELRADRSFDGTGVIMLTGIGEMVNAATAPLYGADDHIDKPIHFAELEFKIRRVLSEKRRKAAAKAAAESSDR